MFYKLFKLFSWFRGHTELLLLIFGVAFIAVAGIQSFRANHWHKEHLRLEGKLGEQKTDQDKLWDKAERLKAERNTEKAKEREKRERLEARIQKVIKEGEKAKRELEKEKQKTATLPPTALVAQIVERIGFESDLTKSGLYLFTRVGAERTLDRFKDGEFYLSEYTKLKETTTDHDAEVASFNVSIAKCEKAEAKNLKGWKDCRETLGTALDDIDALKKVGSAVIWRGRVEGAVGGSIVTIVLCKIFGVF